MSIVSRLKTAAYYQRQCDLAFPAEGNFTYASIGKPEEAADSWNSFTEGWNINNTSRLLMVNGYVQPSRSVTRAGGTPRKALAPRSI